MLDRVGFRQGQEAQPPHPGWRAPGRLSPLALSDHALNGDDNAAGLDAAAADSTALTTHDTTASTSDTDLMRLLGDFTSGPGALTPALSPSVQSFSTTGLSSPSLSVPVHDPSVLPAGDAFVSSSARGFVAPVHSNEEHGKPQPSNSLAHVASKPLDAGDMSLPFDLDFSKFSGFDAVTAFPVLDVSPQLIDPSTKPDHALGVVDPLVFDSSLDSPLGLSGSLSTETSPLSDLLASPLFSVGPDSAVPSATISELPLPRVADGTPLFGSAPTPALPPLPTAQSLSSTLAWFPPLPSGSTAALSPTILRPLPPAPSAPHPSPSMTPWTPALSYTEGDFAPASSSSSSSKAPKRAPTGFRQSSAPLLPLDAPIQPRTSVIPSATSRKRKTAAAEKALAKRGRSVAPAAPEPAAAPRAAADDDLPDDIVAAVERKRLQNTLSARKSRARKQARLQELEAENEALKARVDELERALGLALRA